MNLKASVNLVRADGSIYGYAPTHKPLALPRERARFETRVAFAAAHVVVDPLRTTEPLTHPVVDWDATLAYRDYLWSLGFGVAEAMDTAQRGMGLDWPLALELIKRTTAAANARGALIASGAGTDHLPAGGLYTLKDVTDAYLEQCEAIEAVDGRIILMASRALAAAARHADDFASVYANVLGQVQQPVILHWLGPMFDPCAGRLLGRNFHCRSDGELPWCHRRASDKDRRHKDLFARCRSGGCDAASASGRSPDVYGR